MEWLSADAAEGCACNKRYDAEDAVDILGKRIEPAADGLLEAVVDFVEDEFLTGNPEEHDTSQQSAERADVDRDDVHPLGGDLLDEDCNHAANDKDDGSSRNALDLQVILQGCDRSFIQVDDGAEAGEQNADEEDDADDPAAGHTVEDIDQPDEHEAGAAALQRSAARCPWRG